MLVKAASRRSRARPARALTGILRSGSAAQAIMANLIRLNARGVNNPICSICYEESQAGVGEHTSRLALDLFDLFHHSTVPHIAAFILPKSGRLSGARQSYATLSQDSIRQKKIKHHESRIGACSFAVDRSTHSSRCSHMINELSDSGADFLRRILLGVMRPADENLGLVRPGAAELALRADQQ